MEIKLVVPSMSFAGQMTTPSYVSHCIICIPKAELGQYKERNPELEYVTHPDTLIGLNPKRDWIYKKFKNVCQLDHDIKGLARMTQKPGERSNLTPDENYHVIQNCGNLAKLSGCYLFGFNLQKKPEYYSGHQPFKLSGNINECCFGMLEGADKLVSDPRVKLGYEWLISGLNAHFYRKAFFDLRYCPRHSYIVGEKSVMAKFRTREEEERIYYMLKEYFGPAVELISERGGKGNAAHKYAKRMKIPF